MKNVFEAAIKQGGYDLPTMLRRIDERYIGGKLSDVEHTELVALARGHASVGVDAPGEVQKLWAALRDLTARVVKLEGGVVEDNTGVTIAEYMQPTGAHDAYYAGDLVSFNGAVYVCVAPDGVACVWSPEVMPAYWDAATIG